MAFVHTSRRGFLVGAGAALVALPFLDLLRGRRPERPARADNAKAGDRLILFYYPHGKFDPYWDVDGSGDQFNIRAAAKTRVSATTTATFPSTDFATSSRSCASPTMRTGCRSGE